MKITATRSKHNKKLSNNGAIIWSPGATTEEVHASCQKVACPFYSGGQFVNVITGEEYDPKTITTRAGTVDTPESYHAPDGSEVIRLDTCFSVKGQPARANGSSISAGNIGLDRLKAMIADQDTDRMVRGAVVGNASGTLSQAEMATLDSTIRSAGLSHVLYDHGWKQHPWILDYAMASCNHMADVERAGLMGAKGATLVLPESTIERLKADKVRRIHGFKITYCPAEKNPGESNCQKCGGPNGRPFCDVQRENRDPLVVIFEQHGPKSWKRRKGAKVFQIAKRIFGRAKPTKQDRRFVLDQPKQASELLEALPAPVTRSTIATRAEQIAFLRGSKT